MFMLFRERVQNTLVFRAILGLSTVALILLNSCAKQDTYRQDADQQYNLEAQQKTQELDQVIGSYCGSMNLLDKSGNPYDHFDADLLLGIGHDVKQSPQSQDATDTVQVPKLVGNLTFPAVRNQGNGVNSSLSGLTGAMGSSGMINFTEGDFNSGTHQIDLPYTAAGGTQEVGELSGSYASDGHFTGTWYANSYTPFGTFDLKKCPATPGNGS